MTRLANPSEMYAFLDWRQLANEVIERSQNERYRALFQVIDISEFNYLIKASKGPAAFNKYLIQRWIEVNERGTAYLKALAY